MPFTRYYYPACGFSYTHGTGVIDDHDLCINVLMTQIELKDWKMVRGLLDCRNVQRSDKITFQGLQRACEIKFDEHKDRDYCGAILISADKHRMVADIATHMLRMSHLKINVFVDDIDEALEWLGYDEITTEYLKGKIDRHLKKVYSKLEN